MKLHQSMKEQSSCKKYRGFSTGVFGFGPTFSFACQYYWSNLNDFIYECWLDTCWFAKINEKLGALFIDRLLLIFIFIICTAIPTIYFITDSFSEQKDRKLIVLKKFSYVILSPSRHMLLFGVKRNKKWILHKTFLTRRIEIV